MKYTESTLVSWTKPVSDTEEQKIQNTINMIKSAIDSSHELKDLTIEIFVQGSYANNTNVKANSDVDVCVMLKSTFYTEYPDGKNRSDYGFIEGDISYAEYRRRVRTAIVNKFGSGNVTDGNKSIKIQSNSYHVNADVVVAFMLKNFKIINSVNPNRYVEGTRFYSMSCTEVTNYPKKHISNGKNKNIQTDHRYKYLTRIFKHIRNAMVDDGKVNGEKISSFLVECLIWNVPNNIITGYSNWTETVKQAIIHLYNAIKDGNQKEWGEVSECFCLFHPGRKWTAEDAKTFLYDMWNYLEY
ncbi:MAG: nucleotidyltransferase [Clostridia bacterium]|nr:nucleotidyltransferase [Clostridia bacterium]